MFSSIYIGRFFGINVRVHWTFLALFVFLVARDPNPVHIAVDFVMLFGIVYLHELGHSLVARHFGIQVLDITFWPLGGMARMSEMPESSKIEGWVAIAGPAVNFVLAGAGIGALATLGAVSFLSSSANQFIASASWPVRTLGEFIYFNLALGIFNLVPAFPMDGGRVLRAVFATWKDWLRATELAVTIGRAFAVMMIVAGFLTYRSGGTSLILIGLFVFWAGARELWAIRLKHGRIPFGPQGGRPMASAFGAPVEPATVAVHDEPIPKGDGDPETGARRPLGDWRSQTFGRARVSDDAIERMERFRGRLDDDPHE